MILNKKNLTIPDGDLFPFFSTLFFIKMPPQWGYSLITIQPGYANVSFSHAGEFNYAGISIAAQSVNRNLPE